MRRGRLEVERYFVEMADALEEAVWSETDATSRLLLAARPQVRFIPFNPSQEGGSRHRTGLGADWMWWWIAPSGVCFGVLVQAKNLRRRTNGWSIDLEYRNKRQLSDLLEASDVLGVPAAYLLYCGNPEYRADLACGPSHSQQSRDRCHRSGVCILPALVARDLVEASAIDRRQDAAAVTAYQWALPLEDLVDHRLGPHWVVDLNVPLANADLRQFLTQPQAMPLAIAKRIFAMVSRFRQVRMSATATDMRDADINIPLFKDTLSGEGHLHGHYLDHVLRGLRREPPSFIAAVAAGTEPPKWLGDRVAGLVLVDVL